MRDTGSLAKERSRGVRERKRCMLSHNRISSPNAQTGYRSNGLSYVGCTTYGASNIPPVCLHYHHAKEGTCACMFAQRRTATVGAIVRAINCVLLPLLLRRYGYLYAGCYYLLLLFVLLNYARKRKHEISQLLLRLLHSFARFGRKGLLKQYFHSSVCFYQQFSTDGTL